jgi:hypothetical protein
MKEKKEEKPSQDFDYLVKEGMDPTIALEIDNYNQQKGKRRKRMKRDKEEDEKWK